MVLVLQYKLFNLTHDLKVNFYLTIVGPLYDLDTWYRLNDAGMQIMKWDL